MNVCLCVSNGLHGRLGSHSCHRDTVTLMWPFASSWPRYLNSLHSVCSNKSRWMRLCLSLAQSITLPLLPCHTFRIWGKNKSLNQCLCSNVLATLAQCEALIWTLFFVGHAVLVFFVLINSSSVSCHHWYELAHWWKCFLGCYEKRLETNPPHAIGLLQSHAANEEAPRPVNFSLSLTLPAPQMNMHNLHACEPWTFEEGGAENPLDSR